MEYATAMPNKHTFLISPIKEFVMRYYRPEEVWIDPFCGRYSPVPHSHKNDLDPAIPAKYHLEAKDFLKLWEDESIDGIISDPPYSIRQLKECYNAIGIEKLSVEETQLFPDSMYVEEFQRVLKPGGLILKFGWNSNQFSWQFKRIHLLLVNHGNRHHDTICTAQKRTQATLGGRG